MRETILHVGYPKTATSWLQRSVFNNQEIHLKTVSRGLIFKQLIYPNDLDYDKETAKQLIFSEMERIENDGDIPILSHENFVGFMASGGYYNFNLAKRLKDLFVQAKVIMIIRNQPDMIYSGYLQYIRMGGKCSIKRFLNPPEDGEIPLFKCKYLEYHKLIELYYRLFGNENVLVLPYEFFLKTPEAYVKEIVHFINANPPATLEFNKIENKSMRGIGVSLKRFSNKFVSRYESINADAPIIVSVSTTEIIKGIFNKMTEITPAVLNNKVTKLLMTKIKKNINGKYIQSNKRTAEIIGMNLKSFCYDLGKAIPLGDIHINNPQTAAADFHSTC